MSIDLTGCETYQVLGDMGAFIWNEKYGADDPVFREAALATLDLPDEYPEDELTVAPVMVEMAYVLKDRNGEVVALIFNRGKVKG